MKKIVRSITVVALMIMTATGLASEPKLSLTPNTEKSLNFEMDALSEQSSLSIVDNEGVVIYSEDIAAANIFAKKFDLRNLPEGNYFLKVEDSLKEAIFSFSVEKSKIVIAERKENSKPIFRKKEGRVFINLLNLTKEAVEIKVYDDENRIVFKETILETALVEKVINFEKAFKGIYTIKIKDESKSYYESIVVK